MQKKLTVGARGEIYITQDIRRAVGIEPGAMVLAEVSEGQLILRPRETAAYLLQKPRIRVPVVYPKKTTRLRKKLVKDLEER